MDNFKTNVDTKQGDLFGSSNKVSEKTSPKIPELKELYRIYEEEWIDDWYESPKHKEEYRTKGKEILKDFHAKVKSRRPSIYYLEQGFNLKIQDPTTKRVYTIFGVIDRVDKSTGDGPASTKASAGQGVEIIDYKTGTVKSEKYIDKDQLLIYQIAAQEVLDLKPEKLTFYYLNENKPVSFLGTPEELEKTKKKILDFVNKVKDSDFRATPSQHTCKYCDYRNICEYRQI